MEKLSVISVVVTYNRLDLLKNSLNSILNQTYPVEKVIIIDNASNDGSDDFLKRLYEVDKRVCHIRLNKNMGGAGGFHIGLAKAYEYGADFVWLMDDDAEATPSALNNLILHGMEINASFLCSNVFGPDGLPMNLPEVDFRPGNNGYPTWTDKLSSGLVKVRTCTFVSILISRQAIKSVGLPIKEMFLWGDDGEYSMRLSNYSKGYLVGNSIILHRRKNNNKLKILDEIELVRVANYFYYYRNNLYIARKYKSINQLISFIFNAVREVIKSCRKGNFNSAKVITKGIVHGFFFNPQIRQV